MPVTSEESRIARLEARVAELEAALARRSDLLRLLQRHLSGRDLVLLARLADGLSPLPWNENDLASWRETTDLTPSDVESALTGLWASLTPGSPASPVSPTPGGAAS